MIMKASGWRALFALAALSTIFLLPRSGGTSVQAAGRHAVVVELFTSEGCSSCPPADELLGHLRSEPRADGVEVIPLGLHVDYWNFQGWNDRFSSNAYSQRQSTYAERFRLQGPYTPQMVFDGAAQSDGDIERAHALIERAAQQPEIAGVSLSLVSEDKLTVNVKTSQDLRGEVMLAITEDNLSSKVGAGENNGRQLRHSAVVRELRSLGSIRDRSFQATVPLKIKKDWKRGDLRVVVLVQESGLRAIAGAASLSLANQSASR